MIKRILVLVVMTLLAVSFFPLASHIEEKTALSPLAAEYIENGPGALNAPNLVTSVIVTYRGLDTLGEVTVLFAAAAGIALVFARRAPAKSEGGESEEKKAEQTEPSEILKTGAGVLLPLIMLFGVYIFLHGHLTPGGGFQGGVVIASGVFLALVAGHSEQLSHRMLGIMEMLAGAGYVAVGLLGIWLAAGFLDPRFLPSGRFGALFSAGAIPLIYSLIGVKVGAELSGIIDTMKRSRP